LLKFSIFFTWPKSIYLDDISQEGFCANVLNYMNSWGLDLSTTNEACIWARYFTYLLMQKDTVFLLDVLSSMLWFSCVCPGPRHWFRL